MIVIFYYYPSAAGEWLMLNLTNRTLRGMNERGKRRASEEKNGKKWHHQRVEDRQKQFMRKLLGAPGRSSLHEDVLGSSICYWSQMTKMSNFHIFHKSDADLKIKVEIIYASDNKSAFLAGKLAFNLDWCRHTSKSGSYSQVNIKV